MSSEKFYDAMRDEHNNTVNNSTEKAISDILELQGSLSALINRVESVRVECSSLQSENQMLQKYVNNLLTSKAVLPGNDR
ncbi:uncharacterized protein VTP21DRAFT_11584 [Calcarisporiella thermophila]|uniref:uncharacterized protein n=1 Tax=Calcarisporiella thermophila TaxID=911321 RepID=UPI0037420BC2